MRVRFLILGTAVVLLVSVSGACAQSTDAPPIQAKGIDAALMASAKAGNPKAEFEVGLHYEHPDGTLVESNPEDCAQAAFWYRKAAEQGLASAQYYLSDLYLFGHGVPVDYEQGIFWTRKAAEQGHPSAQTNLALWYLNGTFVPQNYAQAVYWYRKAAELGNPDGQVSLAGLYEYGRGGLPQDYAKAYFWMSLAAANPELAGQYFFLAQQDAEERDKIALHLTNTELLRVQEQVKKWAEDHAASKPAKHVQR